LKAKLQRKLFNECPEKTTTTLANIKNKTNKVNNNTFVIVIDDNKLHQNQEQHQQQQMASTPITNDHS
jgi:hypothetical protein